MATIVEGDQKSPFSKASSPRYKGGRYSFPKIVPLYPWYLPYIAVLSKEVSSNIFKVFGMSQPGIEPSTNIRSIFKRIKTVFSFSEAGCHKKFKEPRLIYYLPIALTRIASFMPFPGVGISATSVIVVKIPNNQVVSPWEWVKSFAIFSVHESFQLLYPVPETIQAVDSWRYRDSWCTDTLCIASICVWFESHTDKRVIVTKSLNSWVKRESL